jgi:hypothetical protein
MARARLWTLLLVFSLAGHGSEAGSVCTGVLQTPWVR